MAEDPTFTPLVLMIEDHQWTARSLESILAPAGYAVFKAYSGKQGLEILLKMMPDIILVGSRLPDMTGPEVLARIAEVPTVFPSTPRVAVASDGLSHRERMEVLEAGAWDVLYPPFEAHDLIVRMGNWTRAKRDADAARDNGLVDPVTGLYNFNGLLRRVDELVSEASRSERFVSFVMLGPARLSDDVVDLALEADQAEVTRHLGHALAASLRASDAVGRLGRTEFVIVAPGTDEAGASMLARRLIGSLRDSCDDSPALQAGVYAMQQPHGEEISSIDLLGRATAALRVAQRSGSSLTA